MADSFHPGAPPPAQPPDQSASKPREPADFFDRIVRYLNDAMSPEEVQAFDAELAADPANLDIFIQACLAQGSVSEELSSQYHLLREALLNRQLGEKEAAPSPPSIEPPVQTARRWRRWALAAAVTVLAGTLAFLFRNALLPPAPPVPFAAVTGSHNVQWTVGPDVRERITPNTELSLNSGWAQITYTTGTKVTVIGPASFTAESPTLLKLRTGRLTASVSGRNFAVLTPEARIADLGTEFGVSMLDRTELAVFSGKVEAQSLHDLQGANRRVLSEGQVAGIRGDLVVDDAQQAWPQLFPRKLKENVTSLSVADLLSGGDGTMGRRDAALDLATGRWSTGQSMPLPASVSGDHAYHQVPQLRVLDGCFIPDGPTRIDSAGHTFAFSATTNTSYNQLWVGGVIPWLRQDPHRMRTALGSVDYGQPPHNVVEFHSNKGITLDLEALRAIHPGVVFGEFRAVLGNSFPRRVGGESSVAQSGVFVLVDGQIRFENRAFSNQEDPATVRVSLRPDDRFLCLAVTDGGDGLEGDWILWGDPEITVTETAP